MTAEQRADRLAAGAITAIRRHNWRKAADYLGRAAEFYAAAGCPEGAANARALLGKLFGQAIAETTDADRIARLELAREYWTDPEFRRRLEQAAWDANNPPSAPALP